MTVLYESTLAYSHVDIVSLKVIVRLSSIYFVYHRLLKCYNFDSYTHIVLSLFNLQNLACLFCLMNYTHIQSETDREANTHTHINISTRIKLHIHTCMQCLNICIHMSSLHICNRTKQNGNFHQVSRSMVVFLKQELGSFKMVSCTQGIGAVCDFINPAT